MTRRVVLCMLMCTAIAAASEPARFEDSFRGAMTEGWSWIRADRAGWRISDEGLEIRVQPGNMWGGANDAKNVLVRPIPDVGHTALEVSVVVENHPTEQYEQVDLVWYYADSHMVKIGQERVDGQLSIVMGREADDRTRTIAIVPVVDHQVALRLRVEGDQIQGAFRTLDSEPWTTVGQCDLPRKGDTPAQVSLQAYQGPKDAAHWARIQDLQIRDSKP